MDAQDATIYEVARRSGVSISTVSLAINHPERVRIATRTRILGIADEIGFVPKEKAIARARTGVGRIAVVAPFTSYPSFSRRMEGALDAIGDDGTQLLVYDHEDSATSTSPLLASIPIRGHVDGLIIMAIPLDESIAERLRNRLPTVLVDMAHPGLPSVVVDDVEGGRMVGRQLRDWGHSNVAFVRETDSRQSMVRAPEIEFVRNSPTARRFSGISSVFGEGSVRDITVGRTPAAGAEAIDQLFGEGTDPSSWPTAIFTNRDLVALLVLSAARARGLRVPEDLSIVGFDDDPMSSAVGLSTVENPFEESGRVAVKMLRERMAGSGEVSTVDLPLVFRDRDTAGAVRSELPRLD